MGTKLERLSKRELIDKVEKLQNQLQLITNHGTGAPQSIHFGHATTEQLQAFFEYAPDACYLTDMKGHFLDGNRAAEKLVGYSREELLGKSFLKIKLLSRTQIPKAAYLLAKIAMGQSTGPDDFTLTRKDGRQITVEIKSFPIQLKNSHVVLGIARDVTARKQLENMKRKRISHLDERVKELECLYGLSEIISRDASLDEILQSTVALLPIGWQFPEIAGCRIIFQGKEYISENFKETQWLLSSDISVHDDKVGTVQIVYVEERPQQFEGPFSQEERQLLDNVAEKLGRVIDHKQTEAALEQERHFFNTFMANVPDAIYFKNTDGRFLRVNHAQAKRLGLEDPKQAVNKTDFDFFERKDAQRVLDESRDLMESGEVLVQEIAKSFKGGGKTWVLATRVPYYDEAGRIAGVFGVTRDITDRKKTEAALKESEAKFRAISAAAQDAIIMMDHEGKVSYWNSAAQKMFGFTKNNIVGKPLHKLIVPQKFYEHFEKAFTGFQQTGKGQAIGKTLELTAMKRTGTEFPVELSLSAVKLKGKWQAIGIIRDITERKLVEEQLTNLLTEKEVLLKEVHHRVKNNFAVVASLLNIQSAQIEDKTAKEIFLQSRDRVKSMALIHERLYQSRDVASINFGEYIRTLAVGLYQSFGVDSTRISLITDLEDIFLTVDQAIPTGLIVNELLTNSIKYGFPNGRNGKGEIRVALRERKNNQVELSVSDNGVGLPKDFDLSKTNSLGLKLVSMLSNEQLRGCLEINGDGGAAFIIQFEKAT